MNPKKCCKVVLASLLLMSATIIPLQAPRVSAATRDHLTPTEAERVREIHVLDKRIEVFIKAAERRLLVLTDPNAASSKQAQKDLEKWGELPKGTRAELLTDLAKILDEAITNIEDVNDRDANNRLLPKALRKLADASNRFLAQLTPMRERAPEEGGEREALEQAVENMQAIIEATNKLPPPTNEKEKGKS